MPEPASSVASRKIPALDSVRGLAITAVLLFHAFFEMQARTGPEYLVRKLLAPLWFGVDIFFVLSGFLITGILIDTQGAPNYFKSFYVRRTLRIAPLYFAALALFFLALPVLHVLPRVPLDHQLPYWTYTYNWAAVQGYQVEGMVHFWSLAVEEQFYLVWPLVLFALPVRRMPLMFLALIGASFLFRLSMFLLGQPFKYAYFSTPARIEDLCIGALAAYLVRSPTCLPLLPKAIPKFAWGFAVLFGIAASAGYGFEQNKWPVLIFGTTSVCGIAALLILQSVTVPAPHWWDTPILRWLGTYSYGIYVFHQPIMYHLNRRLTAASLPQYAGAMAGAIALSCLIAWLSYYGFERYFLRLKSRFLPN